MNATEAKAVLDTTFGRVFGYENPYELDEFMNKFAFDVRLPVEVEDAITHGPAWTQSLNQGRFITLDTARDREWEGTPGELNDVQDVMRAWNEINYVATNREIDSINVSESDNVYNSENIYRSLDIARSKNVLFSDGGFDCENIIASQRSNTSTFSIRLEDSKECTSSFSVTWSAKIVNSFFIHNCFDMYESMFCSHLASKKFCIANQQFEEAEYRRLKDLVIRWVLTS